ncbi:MAG: serine hydrolase domain-containing protein [Caulobacteraceae bacterium]
MEGAPRDLSPARPEEVGLAAGSLSRIDDLLLELVTRGELGGASALVARRGRIVHSVFLGLRDIAAAAPIGPETIFHIYSMTKPVTAVAMMILREEGLWRPGDPISRHLPGWDRPMVFSGLDAAGSPTLEPADHSPTMAELMTHTAGFTYGFDPSDPLTPLYERADPWRAADLAGFADRLAAVPLAYQPGSKWLYSLSMDLQGAIIERLTGQSFAAFAQDRIFAPLGMVDTAFHTPPDKRARLAKVYRRSERRGLVEIERLILPDHEAPPALASGGGGLVSTLFDYARFAQMLLDGGKFGAARVLTPSSIEEMTSNHLSEVLMAGGFGVGKQQIRPGFGYGYNGGVFTDPARAGLPVGRGTYQWDGAAGTWFWVDPENDLLFVGMIQRMDPDSPPLQAMTQRLIGEALGLALNGGELKSDRGG